MARLINAMVTEEDIKYLGDTGKVLLRFEFASYSKRVVTKRILENLIYIDESIISSLSAYQGVKYGLIDNIFTTNIDHALGFSSSSYTKQFELTTNYGYSTSSTGNWLTITPPSASSSGLKLFTMKLSTNNTTSNRTATLTFTEKVTGKKINILVTQSGQASPHFTLIPLVYTSSENDICEESFLTRYYIPNESTFDNTNTIYSDAVGISVAVRGYYKNPLSGKYRFWNGVGFSGGGICVITEQYQI